MKRLLCLIILIISLLTACTQTEAKPTETPISWSIVEEIDRDGNTVYYQEHLDNGMTVDRWTEDKQ